MSFSRGTNFQREHVTIDLDEDRGRNYGRARAPSIQRENINIDRGREYSRPRVPNIERENITIVRDRGRDRDRDRDHGRESVRNFQREAFLNEAIQAYYQTSEGVGDVELLLPDDSDDEGPRRLSSLPIIGSTCP